MKKVKHSNNKHKETELALKLKSEKRKYDIILGAIVLFTFILYAKSINYSFLNYDDNSYLTRNFLIRDFSFHGFKKIFSTPVIGMYNPLPFVIYTFLYKFWALNTIPYNIVNIISHLIAVIAVFKFIHLLTKRYEPAAIVALLFAIHPMHVSVVSWASETKTSLYSIFYFLALVNYIKYIRSDYRIKYLIYTALLFLLSVLSKPEAVTLAPMLLLIDYYLSRKIDRRLIVEKIPFFAISIFFGILTLLTHLAASDSIFESNNNYSLINNILVSNFSVAFYLNKIFAPFNLSAIYSYPRNTPLLSYKYYLSVLTIPFVLWLVYKSGKFKKEMIFGLLYFTISISILLRIVPSGFFRASNVYTYMSYTGLFFIVGQFYTYVIDNKLSYANRIKKYIIYFLFMLFIIYAVQTIDRISVYQNNITFYNDIIARKPRLALAYNNRGIAKGEAGDVAGAFADYSKAIQLNPKDPLAYNNRAQMLVDQKKYDEAMNDLNIAISLDPKYDEAYINRGNIFYYEGKYDEAFNDYSSAIRFDSTFELGYKNRASVALMKHDDNAALKDLNKALSINPEYFDAYIDRGGVKYRQGKLDEALKDYNRAIKINPYDANAYTQRALVETAQQNVIGAQQDAQKAAELSAAQK